jgi:hypothetical protein
MADRLCRGFVHHDRRQREEAVDAFAAVDRLQFSHADQESCRRAAEGYVEALWAKDEVERRHERTDGSFDRDALAAADWSAVREGFAARAEAVGIDRRYAELSTIGWRRHKTREDYWTPLQRAQVFELQVALQDDEYPHKPRYGQSGFGPEAARYVLGVELHDARRWEEARTAMVPYFERVLADVPAETLPSDVLESEASW